MVDGMASIFFRVYFGSASDTNFIMPGTAFSYHIIHEIKTIWPLSTLHFCLSQEMEDLPKRSVLVS